MGEADRVICWGYLYLGHKTTASEAIQARATSYHWAMKDVPALREEPRMATADGYVARIGFELAGENMPSTGYRNVAGRWWC